MKYLVIVLLVFILGCDEPVSNNEEQVDIEIDYSGVSKLYVVNNSYDSIAVTIDVYAEDGSVEIGCKKGDTVFIYEDGYIGGWLRPSRIIQNDEIKLFNENKIEVLVDTLIVDSGWVYSKMSSWEKSFWYFSL